MFLYENKNDCLEFKSQPPSKKKIVLEIKFNDIINTYYLPIFEICTCVVAITRYQ